MQNGLEMSSKMGRGDSYDTLDGSFDNTPLFNPFGRVDHYEQDNVHITVPAWSWKVSASVVAFVLGTLFIYSHLHTVKPDIKEAAHIPVEPGTASPESQHSAGGLLSTAPTDGAVEWAHFEDPHFTDDMWVIKGKFQGELIPSPVTFTISSTSKPGGVNDLCKEELDVWHINSGKCFTSLQRKPYSYHVTPPIGCDIVRWSEVGQRIIKFDQPVYNLHIAIVSLSHKYFFNRDFEILSDNSRNAGFDGNGKFEKSEKSCGLFGDSPCFELKRSEGKASGVIRFGGMTNMFTCFNPNSEGWHGMQLGIMLKPAGLIDVSNVINSVAPKKRPIPTQSKKSSISGGIGENPSLPSNPNPSSDEISIVSDKSNALIPPETVPVKPATGIGSKGKIRETPANDVSAMCDLAAALKMPKGFKGWSCTSGKPKLSVCDWYGVKCTSTGGIDSVVLPSKSIRGSLPQTIAKLDSLRVLDLQDNLIEGTLPRDIGKLASLEILSLGDNALKGTLPSALGKLSKLMTLQMNNNSFSGELPALFDRLPVSTKSNQILFQC